MKVRLGIRIISQLVALEEMVSKEGYQKASEFAAIWKTFSNPLLAQDHNLETITVLIEMSVLILNIRNVDNQYFNWYLRNMLSIGSRNLDFRNTTDYPYGASEFIGAIVEAQSRTGYPDQHTINEEMTQ